MTKHVATTTHNRAEIFVRRAAAGCMFVFEKRLNKDAAALWNICNRCLNDYDTKNEGVRVKSY
jgi:hypothetical protein